MPLVGKLPELESQKCAKVISEMKNPHTCWSEFFAGETAASDVVKEEDDDEDAAAGVVEASKLNTLKGEFNKATGSLLELLMDLMRGQFLGDCRKLSQENVKLAQAVADAAAPAIPDKDEQPGSSSFGLVKSLVLVVQSFDTATKSVSLQAPLPMPSLVQSLNPDKSSEADAACRERAWKQVQTERRKFVSFSVAKYSKDALQTAFRNCGKVWAHKGDLNSSHRFIVGSADLLLECAQQPWFSASVPTADAWTCVTDFCMGIVGAADFVFLFDGRMREIRRVHVTWLVPSNTVCCKRHLLRYVEEQCLKSCYLSPSPVLPGRCSAVTGSY